MMKVSGLNYYNTPYSQQFEDILHLLPKFDRFGLIWFIRDARALIKVAQNYLSSECASVVNQIPQEVIRSIFCIFLENNNKNEMDEALRNLSCVSKKWKKITREIILSS